MGNFLTFESPQLITTSANTAMFLREVIERKSKYREALFMKLTSVFDEIRGPPVIRMAIWMLGEFAESK